MAATHDELLEILLRTVAGAGPQPWYPGQFAQSTGVPRELLDAALDRLRLAGLVQLTPWAQGYGQGYRATPHGLEVLRQPRLLARLRGGEVPQAPQEKPAPEPGADRGLRGDKIRDALFSEARPIITQILLALNILWFLATLAIYLQLGGTVGNFFHIDAGDAKLAEAHDQVGSLSVLDLQRGQWWRLLTYGFVHANILHIGMNMYALFVLGPLMEKMWGRAPYLALYLLACIGGGAFAVVLTPSAYLVGASGAICGLLGSMVTWLLLNKAYLPPRVVQAWQRNIVTNLVLIVIVSLLPGVSWAGHLGGGVTGAVVGVPLNLAHFGDGMRRWLGWAGAAAVAVVGFVLLQGSLASRPGAGSRVEVRAANQQDIPQMTRAESLGYEAKQRAKSLLLGARHPDEAKAAEQAAEFRKEKAKMDEALAKLAKLGPYQQPDLKEYHASCVAFVTVSSQLAAKMADLLESKKAWPPETVNALRTELQQAEQRYQASRAAWDSLQAYYDGSKGGE
jgi:membrane associated rhomboid family serine protease